MCIRHFKIKQRHTLTINKLYIRIIDAFFVTTKRMTFITVLTTYSSHLPVVSYDLLFGILL